MFVSGYEETFREPQKSGWTVLARIWVEIGAQEWRNLVWSILLFSSADLISQTPTIDTDFILQNNSKFMPVDYSRYSR